MNQILHLGLGRFHRGHQAVYYQKAGGWKIVSSTMRSANERDKLRAVHHRYPVLELSHDYEKLTWIDCIQETLSLHENLDRLIQVFVSPETKIVSLTVTEKGYCLNQVGELDLDHGGIKKDLSFPDRPQTAIGLIALGMRKRQDKLTILSCDNLRENGNKLQSAVMKFLELSGHKVNAYLFSFPNTMVDRIVPSLLPEKVVELETLHKLSHSELIATESFSQWVIEDNFINGRPDWDKVGVEFVRDVRPYEEMKLRLLNASHSYLAYAGLNRGYQYVHQAIADERLYSTVTQMLTEEVIPLLVVPDNFNVYEYVRDILKRFRNDKLPHQLKQIAMDGSHKIPQRIFSSITEAKKRNLPYALLLKATDEWMEFLWNNREGKIDDPKASEIFSGISAGKDVWKRNLIEQISPALPE